MSVDCSEGMQYEAQRRASFSLTILAPTSMDGTQTNHHNVIQSVDMI